jgi:hypothetical protein
MFSTSACSARYVSYQPRITAVTYLVVVACTMLKFGQNHMYMVYSIQRWRSFTVLSTKVALFL